MPADNPGACPGCHPQGVQPSASLYWKDAQINLIDTPGHIDFSADVERSLSVLDAAVLVVSAVEGVQAHTENIWLALKEYQIPTLIFINKINIVFYIFV